MPARAPSNRATGTFQSSSKKNNKKKIGSIVFKCQTCRCDRWLLYTYIDVFVKKERKKPSRFETFLLARIERWTRRGKSKRKKLIKGIHDVQVNRICFRILFSLSLSFSLFTIDTFCTIYSSPLSARCMCAYAWNTKVTIIINEIKNSFDRAQGVQQQQPTAYYNTHSIKKIDYNRTEIISIGHFRKKNHGYACM